jgi:hypothetical protein
MNPFAIAAIFLAASSAGAWAASGSAWISREDGKTCLRTDHIQRKTVPDNRTILFRMDDGTTWKNTLQKTCPGLAIASGFAMTVKTNYICANQQPIRVIGAGNTCYLGGFVQVPPKP